MKMKNAKSIIALYMGLISFVSFGISKSDNKLLKIYNKTNETIRVLVQVDNQDEQVVLPSLVLQKTAIVIPFNMFNSLKIDSTGELSSSALGMAPRDYSGPIMDYITKDPKHNVLVTITPPDTSGMFGYLANYFRPYQIEVKQYFEKEDASKTALEREFSYLLSILRENSDQEITTTDILGIAPSSSFIPAEQEPDPFIPATGNIALESKKSQWQKILQNAQTEQEKTEAKKALRILALTDEVVQLNLKSRKGEEILQKLKAREDKDKTVQEIKAEKLQETKELLSEYIRS